MRTLSGGAIRATPSPRAEKTRSLYSQAKTTRRCPGRSRVSGTPAATGTPVSGPALGAAAQADRHSTPTPTDAAYLTIPLAVEQVPDVSGNRDRPSGGIERDERRAGSSQ